MPGILGIITNQLGPREASSQLSSMLSCMLHEPFYTYGTYVAPEHGCYLGWVAHPKSFADANPVINDARDRILILGGEQFAHDETASTSAVRSGTREEDARQLLRLYETKGERFLLESNGWFAGVLIDLREKTVLLFNDRFGAHRVYYRQGNDSFTFASEAKSLLAVCPDTRTLDSRALGEFVGFGTVLDNRTLFANILTLPGGSLWAFSGSEIKKRRYFTPSDWEQQPVLADDAFYARLRGTMSRILPTYFRSYSRVGMSLTGGLDTRMIMAGRPALQATTPCYTYGGVYRNCFDVRLAHDVAQACDQPHHIIPLGADFFMRFPDLAEETVWLTDGCLDICGSHEVYFSRQARELAPIRLTGNYGSEVVRNVSTFKYMPPAEGLFDDGVIPYIRESSKTFDEINAGHRVSFAAFKEIPWHLYGRLAAAQSQLTVRSPFMDNEVVSLMYRARPQLRETNAVALRLIADLNPALATIGTDMGYAGTRSPIVGTPDRLYRYLLFKAEWYYNAGLPAWLGGLDRGPLVRAARRLFLGTHKIEHYRVWFREQLFDYIDAVLSDRSTASRPHLNSRAYKGLVAAHRRRRGNLMNEISKVITLELVHRLLLRGVSEGRRTVKLRAPIAVGDGRTAVGESSRPVAV